MTLDTMIYQVMTRCKHTATAVSLDRAAAKQLINKALQLYYPIALRADETFYTKSTALAATSSASIEGTTESTYALPSDFFKAKSIEVVGAKEGAAILCGHRDFININNNPFEGVSTTNPIARVDASTFVIRPGTANCTLNYIWRFGFVDTETTELSKFSGGATAIIPWMFEEPVILEAVRMVRMRHNLIVDQPSNGVASLKVFDDAIKAIQKGNEPIEIYGSEVITPR